jgi:hypothetical protein
LQDLNIQKERRGVTVSSMITSTAQKINLNHCTHEGLFKALARIEARIATTSARGKDRVAHPIKHIAAMSEHYVPLEADNVSTTKLGNPHNSVIGYQAILELTRYTGRRKE